MSRYQVFKLMVCLVAFLGLCMASAKLAHAQSRPPIDIAVSPPTTYLQIKPGEEKTYQVTLEQRGTLPLEITPSIVDFTSDGKTGQPILGNGSRFRHISATLPQPTIDEHTFVLTPDSRKSVVFTLDIPENAAEGEYPLSLLFRAQAQRDTLVGGQDSGNSEVSGVIGSNLIVLISYSDHDRSNLQLESITSPRVVDSFSHVVFELLARNAGQNASTASGSATITNWQGQSVATFPIYPDMILAQSTRQLRTTPSLVDAQTDPSLINTRFTYDSWFLFGPYTITATLTPSSENAIGTSVLSLTVVAFPFSIILVVVLMGVMWTIYRFLAQKHTILPRQTLEADS